MCWQASTPLWRAGLFEFRSLLEPPCSRKPGWPPLPVTGSGKSLIRCERMHLAKLKYSLSVEEIDKAALDDAPADDELTLAPLFESSHAAASMASPAEALSATATRSASGNTHRGQPRMRSPSFITSPSVATVPVLALKTEASSASAQDWAAILRL
jgi:hypothetical protein